MRSLSRSWVQQCSRHVSQWELARVPLKFPSERRSQHTVASLNPAASRVRRVNSWLAYPTSFLLLAGVGIVAYENYQPFRHTVLAVARCSRIAGMHVLQVLFECELNDSQRRLFLVPLTTKSLLGNSTSRKMRTKKLCPAVTSGVRREY